MSKLQSVSLESPAHSFILHEVLKKTTPKPVKPLLFIVLNIQITVSSFNLKIHIIAKTTHRPTENRTN